MSAERYVIGVDFGSDSCRAVLMDACDGRRVADSSCEYPRWIAGKYCNPAGDRYRQHPQDYIDVFRHVIGEIAAKAGASVMAKVEGMSFDTTASTPVLVDGNGTPLALLPEFAEDPDAMFILWKDHTSKAEADEINALAHGWDVDYTSFSGGIYSPEWAWAKVLHVLRTNDRVAGAACSWMEHCDWMTAWLTGDTRPEKIFRSRCAAGHKAMWRAEWGGLPSEEFLNRLDPRLGAMRARLYEDSYTSDVCAGTICPELAAELGLPGTMKVGVGAIDAHVGAVGASISEDVLTRIVGTSTCDILVSAAENVGDRRIKGICGQVNGSVIPGLIGFEAGQAAFGDVYAWYKRLLLWPLQEFLPEEADRIGGKLLPALEKAAAGIEAGPASVIALDWFNGRRTPDSDHRVKGAVAGLTLGTTAPMIYRALIEATAFGTKAIVDRFREEGVIIKSVLAIGGISQKSPLVMQTMADVIGMPVSVVDCDQACALGAGMLAAVAAGIYKTVPEAQKAMRSPLGKTYVPDMDRNRIYMELYRRYEALGAFSREDMKNS